MRLEILRAQETHVVGRHHGALPVHAQLQGALVAGILAGVPDPMQFQIETVAEDPLPLSQQCCGQFRLVGDQRAPDLAAGAPGQRQQAVGVVLQRRPRHDGAALLLVVQPGHAAQA